MPQTKILSDEKLVVLIRTKNKQLYSDLVKRYQDKLMRYAIHLVHDHQKALDVVQDSFIKAYIHLNSFDAKLKFSSWIYRIVHNEAINIAKKYSKETPIITDNEIISDENPENELSKKEITEKANDCLAQMDIKYSEPLELFYLEDKSYEEISDILRIPMGTVATRINRAKGIMKKICQKN